MGPHKKRSLLNGCEHAQCTVPCSLPLTGVFLFFIHTAAFDSRLLMY